MVSGSLSRASSSSLHVFVWKWRTWGYFKFLWRVGVDDFAAWASLVVGVFSPDGFDALSVLNECSCNISVNVSVINSFCASLSIQSHKPRRASWHPCSWVQLDSSDLEWCPQRVSTPLCNGCSPTIALMVRLTASCRYIKWFQRVDLPPFHSAASTQAF